jgi:hypothetical protein
VILLLLFAVPLLLLLLLLASRRVEYAVCLAALCLLQSMEERFDAHSEASIHR